MKMSWEEELEQALKSFGAIVPDPIEYRIHYDEFGKITMCSMQNHPINTNYLVVDEKTYSDYAKYRVNVVKKQLEKVAINPGISVQLKRSDQGYCVVKNHAGLILEQDETHEDVEYYAANN
jgi:hypothetical protein